MLRTRVITALLMASGLLAALFLLPRAGSVAVFAAVVMVAAWEWGGLLKAGKKMRWTYGVLTGVPCAALFSFGMPEAWLVPLWSVALGFWVLAVPVWFRRRWTLRANVAGFLVGWLVLIPAWAGMVSLQMRSPWLLLATLALVWVADIAAYFSGRSFGRRKLAPSISPGKTWEGAAGAAFGVLMYAAAVSLIAGEIMRPSVQTVLIYAACLLVLTAVSVIGDLFESLAKRQAGVKDSSGLLPGHGGVLDRIDSLTSTLPLAGLAALYLF